jgi:DNA-binding response OmpR family regulator
MGLFNKVRDFYLRRTTAYKMTDHILVVDDDQMVADMLCLVFQQNGFKASAAYSADEGLAMARELKPRLLLCDILMPRKSGIDLMAEIGQEMPACHILVMTAHPSHVTRVDLQARQMPNNVRLVFKPCVPEELVRQAESIVRRTLPNVAQ